MIRLLGEDHVPPLLAREFNTDSVAAGKTGVITDQRADQLCLLDPEVFLLDEELGVLQADVIVEGLDISNDMLPQIRVARSLHLLLHIQQGKHIEVVRVIQCEGCLQAGLVKVEGVLEVLDLIEEKLQDPGSIIGAEFYPHQPLDHLQLQRLTVCAQRLHRELVNDLMQRLL